MNANEFMHLPVGVGAGDHAEDRVQQHRRQIEPLAFVSPVVGDGAQNLQASIGMDNFSDWGCRGDTLDISASGIRNRPSKVRELNSPDHIVGERRQDRFLHLFKQAFHGR